jgi:hypothetical protein
VERESAVRFKGKGVKDSKGTHTMALVQLDDTPGAGVISCNTSASASSGEDEGESFKLELSHLAVPGTVVLLQPAAFKLKDGTGGTRDEHDGQVMVSSTSTSSTGEDLAIHQHNHQPMTESVVSSEDDDDGMDHGDSVSTSGRPAAFRSDQFVFLCTTTTSSKRMPRQGTRGRNGNNSLMVPPSSCQVCPLHSHPEDEEIGDEMADVNVNTDTFTSTAYNGSNRNSMRRIRRHGGCYDDTGRDAEAGQREGEQGYGYGLVFDASTIFFMPPSLSLMFTEMQEDDELRHLGSIPCRISTNTASNSYNSSTTSSNSLSRSSQEQQQQQHLMSVCHLPLSDKPCPLLSLAVRICDTQDLKDVPSFWRDRHHHRHDTSAGTGNNNNDNFSYDLSLQVSESPLLSACLKRDLVGRTISRYGCITCLHAPIVTGNGRAEDHLCVPVHVVDAVPRFIATSTNASEPDGWEEVRR